MYVYTIQILERDVSEGEETAGTISSDRKELEKAKEFC